MEIDEYYTFIEENWDDIEKDVKYNVKLAIPDISLILNRKINDLHYNLSQLLQEFDFSKIKYIYPSDWKLVNTGISGKLVTLSSFSKGKEYILKEELIRSKYFKVGDLKYSHYKECNFENSSRSSNEKTVRIYLSNYKKLVDKLSLICLRSLSKCFINDYRIDEEEAYKANLIPKYEEDIVNNILDKNYKLLFEQAVTISLDYLIYNNFVKIFDDFDLFNGMKVRYPTSDILNVIMERSDPNYMKNEDELTSVHFQINNLSLIFQDQFDIILGLQNKYQILVDGSFTLQSFENKLYNINDIGFGIYTIDMIGSRIFMISNDMSDYIIDMNFYMQKRTPTFVLQSDNYRMNFSEHRIFGGLKSLPNSINGGIIEFDDDFQKLLKHLIEFSYQTFSKGSNPLTFNQFLIKRMMLAYLESDEYDRVIDSTIVIEMLAIKSQEPSSPFKYLLPYLIANDIVSSKYLVDICGKLYSIRSNIVHDGGTNITKLTKRFNGIESVSFIILELFRIIFLSLAEYNDEVIKLSTLKIIDGFDKIELLTRYINKEFRQDQRLPNFDKFRTQFFELVNGLITEGNNQNSIKPIEAMGYFRDRLKDEQEKSDYP